MYVPKNHDFKKLALCLNIHKISSGLTERLIRMKEKNKIKRNFFSMKLRFFYIFFSNTYLLDDNQIKRERYKYFRALIQQFKILFKFISTLNVFFYVFVIPKKIGRKKLSATSLGNTIIYSITSNNYIKFITLTRKSTLTYLIFYFSFEITFLKDCFS